MALREAIIPYREPATGAIGLRPNPKDHSEDNLLMFAAVYMALLPPEEKQREGVWFHQLILSCRRAPNLPALFARYPGDPMLIPHDDMTLLACQAPWVAHEFYSYGKRRFWRWPGRPWLRFAPPDFVPTLKACAGIRLNWFDQVMFALALLWDCRDSSRESSGRHLIFWKQRAVWGNHLLTDWAIRKWRLHIFTVFGTIQELFAEYYRPYLGVPHPFVTHAPKQFN